TGGERFGPFEVSATRLGFDEYEAVSQGLISHHYSDVDRTLDVFSIPFRYVWPSELDLMARLAGMTLRERWGGWKREPFTSDSSRHVSVWEKTAAPSSVAPARASAAAARSSGAGSCGSPNRPDGRPPAQQGE